MNRHERREAERHARRAKPAKTLHDKAMDKMHHMYAGRLLLESVRPYEEFETTDLHIKAHTAFKRIKAGSAESVDFDFLSIGFNIAKIRALDIDAGLAEALERAQDAMNAVRSRWIRTGRWGFDGPGMLAVAEAMPIHEAIVNASSPRQIEQAHNTVSRIVLAQRTLAGDQA